MPERCSAVIRRPTRAIFAATALVLLGTGSSNAVSARSDTGALTAVPTQSVLRAGGSVSATGLDRLVSENGDYTVYASAGQASEQGQLEWGAPTLWSVGTNPSPTLEADGALTMQNDGNLVTYGIDASRHPVATWSSGTWGNPGAYATVQDDGNFVVYSAAGKPLWANWAAPILLAHSYDRRGQPGQRLTTYLRAGQSIHSPRQRFVLTMQTDGNLVEYNARGAVWWTGTGGSPGAVAAVQSDGNLVMYTADARALWATGTRFGTEEFQGSLVVQDDGNVVFYNFDGTRTAPLWFSGVRG
ncbi:MAG: mannose-binding lectin [Pseudonocardiales bacterium]|nr:mannose-binding lectin [Pseudonocardiales bacterium]